MKINAVKQGYYQIIENGVPIDSKSSEAEAIQGLINYQLEGREVTMQPPTYRVDIEDEAITSPVKDEIFYAEGYVHLTTKEGVQYIRLRPSMDIVRLTGDVKARSKQGKFILKRTQDTDLIDSYQLHGAQPFEINNDHEIVDYETGRLRLWATEPWRIEYYVNGVLDPASDPADLPASEFNASLTSEEMYRHTRTLNATHGDEVRIVAHNTEGESDDIIVRIETLHQLDQSARIKDLNAQILVIMQEPEPEV